MGLGAAFSYRGDLAAYSARKLGLTPHDNFHIHQRKVTSDTASLEAELAVEASQSTTALISYAHSELSGRQSSDGSQTVQLDPGINQVFFAFRIAAPKRWYPVGYGTQDRYRFSTSIRLGHETAARAEVTTGLRSLELRRQADQWGKSFEFVVNGVSVFAKGANVIPFDSFPNRVTPEVHRRILEAARDAHMNMVREWGGGHYESDDSYDICDELGILVWQEFMFGGDMVPGDIDFQENVRQEAIDQIKRLRDHPSIVIWCGNNEIETGWYHWGDRQEFKESISPETRDRVWQDYIIYVRGYSQESGNGVGRSHPVLAQFFQRKFRGDPRQPAQRRHALLGCVASRGTRGVLHPATAAVHDRIRVSIVSGNADHSDVCQTGRFRHTLYRHAGAPEK